MPRKKATEDPIVITEDTLATEDKKLKKEYIVIKGFRDRITKIRYYIGDVYAGKEERIQELKIKGFIGEKNESRKT